MIIKQLLEEDFVNYKKPSMVIGFPTCDFKCDRECGQCVCQNSALANSRSFNVSSTRIVERYKQNDITKALVIQGLEPLDDMEQLKEIISEFRNDIDDDIVVFTGYRMEEKKSVDIVGWIKENRLLNIVIKFGRFIPNSDSIYDEVLGIRLASSNQVAIKI